MAVMTGKAAEASKGHNAFFLNDDNAMLGLCD
jgi:hypothetical protein